MVGTAAKMPPEQARGKSVDKRAVIWQGHAQPRTSVNLVLGWFDELRELEQPARR